MLTALALLTAAQGATLDRGFRAGISLGEVTDKFEVLDISFSKGLVAFKLVAHALPMEEEPYACKYAGMQALPVSGVMLGIWDLKASKVQGNWMVYDIAMVAEECTSHEESTKRLNAAKAAFEKAGLDIAKKPKAVAVGPKDTSFAAARVSWTRKDVADEEDGMGGMMTTVGYKNGETELSFQIEWQRAMAGTYEFSIDRAFVEGSRAVLLERHHWGSMRGDSDIFYFSPVFAK